MNTKQYQIIAISGYPRKAESYAAHLTVYNYLVSQGVQVVVEEQLHPYLPELPCEVFKSPEYIAQHSGAQLMVVIGGDGNLLKSAIRYAPFDLPVIGVNKGNLGFLAEIAPEQIEESLARLLYQQDHYHDLRTVLDINVCNPQGKIDYHNTALNECAIVGSTDHRIVECEVYIDGRFAFSMRGDGLIVATPTGSTAYNLSAHGPIVHSSLDCLLITPINAHTLTSRPVVVPATVQIEVRFPNKSMHGAIEIYHDGQRAHTKIDDNCVVIKSAFKRAKIVHFCDYDHYAVLAQKLQWGRSLF